MGRRAGVLSIVTLAACLGAGATHALAQATGTASGGYGAQTRTGADAGTAPIHGDDAMAGRDRSGPDGWSFAPVPRTQGASAQAPGEAKTDGARLAREAKVPATSTQGTGADPGLPLATRDPGPSGKVPSSP